MYGSSCNYLRFGLIVASLSSLSTVCTGIPYRQDGMLGNREKGEIKIKKKSKLHELPYKEIEYSVTRLSYTRAYFTNDTAI